MPLYEYEAVGKGCTVCQAGFTLRRPVNAPPLTQCPLCKQPVRKLLSAFNTPNLLKPMSVSRAKNAGFTVLKRVGKGEYERQ